MAKDTRLAPHTARAMEVLADGTWHEEEAVLLEMIRMIPPGRAIRYAEKRRTAQNPKTNTPPPQRAVPRSSEYLRVLGGRALALSALKGSKKLERKTDDNGRWVRLRPEYVERPPQPPRLFPSFPTYSVGN